MTASPAAALELRPAPPAIVVVGAASRDLTTDDPRGWRLGGGVTYASLLLGRLGLRVGALIGVDVEAAGAEELDLLREAGVDLVCVRLERGPVFENIDRREGRLQRCLGASDPVPPSALPAAWAGAPAWLLNPVAGEVPDAWAAVPRDSALVALGWQGMLRRLVDGGWVERIHPAPSPILARADVVGVGADDLGGDVDVDALTALLRPGASLLLTRGERGGLAVEVGADGRAVRTRSWPAIPSAGVVDPTGAGDAFLAGAFAARAEPRLVGGRFAAGWDLRLGAAAGSLACERPGLLGIPDRAAITCRMGEVRRAG